MTRIRGWRRSHWGGGRPGRNEDNIILGRCRPGSYSAGFEVKIVTLVPAVAVSMQGMFFVSSQTSRLYFSLLRMSWCSESMMIRLFSPKARRGSANIVSDTCLYQAYQAEAMNPSLC